MTGSHRSVESKKVISDLGFFFFRVLLSACGLTGEDRCGTGRQVRRWLSWSRKPCWVRVSRAWQSFTGCPGHLPQALAPWIMSLPFPKCARPYPMADAVIPPGMFSSLVSNPCVFAIASLNDLNKLLDLSWASISLWKSDHWTYLRGMWV